jgi:imidazole glycerol-phosphate synthase subunit HisF
VAGAEVLAKRVIPVQLLSGGRLVKTKQFVTPRDVGNPVSSSRIYYANGADELFFLNIDRKDSSIDPLVQVLGEVSRVLFVPLAAGGGISSEEDAWRLIQAGADKVVVNTATYGKGTVIDRIAKRIGCQSVCAAIDVRGAQGRYEPYSHLGTLRQSITLRDHIRRCVDLGAGEILIQSIDRDGMMCGYDLDLLRYACMAAETVPVVCLGGAGNYQHLADAFEVGVDGVACGSLFNFGDNNPLRAKAYLRNRGVVCR